MEYGSSSNFERQVDVFRQLEKKAVRFMRNATTVLIIEDSASVCMFMAQTLQKVGYRVITAADGHEGVTKVI